MNQLHVLIVTGVLCLSVVVVLTLRARREAGLACLELLSKWQALLPADRVARVEEWLGGTDRPGRERAAGLIMQGCGWLDQGSPKRAARPFQIAYHAEPAYEVASMLAFACVKADDEGSDDLLATVIETWDEVGRPDLGASTWERALLVACRRGDAPTGASALGVALWSLPCDLLRRQVGEALTARPEWARPLWGPHHEQRNGNASGG